MEPISDTVNEAENLRLDRSWTLGGKTIVILLNEYSNKTTPDDVLLYLLISASLNLHHGN